jgi:hypothetical protein
VAAVCSAKVRLWAIAMLHINRNSCVRQGLGAKAARGIQCRNSRPLHAGVLCHRHTQTSRHTRRHLTLGSETIRIGARMSSAVLQVCIHLNVVEALRIGDRAVLVCQEKRLEVDNLLTKRLNRT